MDTPRPSISGAELIRRRASGLCWRCGRGPLARDKQGVLPQLCATCDFDQKRAEAARRKSEAHQ